MYLFKRLFAPLCLLVTLVAAPAVSGADAVRSLDWDDLMPADFSAEKLFAGYDVDQFLDGDAEGMNRFEAFKELLQSAPVVGELNGLRVSLPGFALPLEGDGETTRLFLLVPYFGACIHVPPPPANQIVLVRASQGVEIDSLFAPVKVTGRMLVEATSTDLADAGYTLDLAEIEPITDF